MGAPPVTGEPLPTKPGKNGDRSTAMPAWYRLWRWGAFLWVGGLLIVGALAFGGDLARGGLRPCDRLDERLCRDLGPTSCAVWRSQLGHAGTAITQPRHRRWNRPGRAAVDATLHALLRWDATKADNPACYDQLGDDMYPPILTAVRQVVTVAAAGSR